MTHPSRQKIIILAGPTGSGKSRLALQLCQDTRLSNMEIISADSRQIYRHMNIGTAKPCRTDQELVPHHLLDVVDPDQQFSAAEFQRLADHAIEDIYRRGAVPMIVGGTGFYIKALLHGLVAMDSREDSAREALQREAGELGSAALHRRLEGLDAQRAAQIDPHDEYRVIRALEILQARRGSISSAFQDHGFSVQRYDALYCILNIDRDLLYSKINSRVDMMLNAGLVNEVKSLLERYSCDDPGLNAIGYRQICCYLQHQFSLEEAVRLIKRDTRRYSKRQLTWFNKVPDAVWLTPSPRKPDAVYSAMQTKILDFLN